MIVIVLAFMLSGCTAPKIQEPKNPCQEWREDLKMIYDTRYPTYGEAPIILCPGEEYIVK